MELMKQPLQAYGVDLMRVPANGANILLPDPGETPGIFIETILDDQYGEPVVANRDIVTGYKFYPEPGTTNPHDGEHDDANRT